MGSKISTLNDWNFDAEVIAADVPVVVIFGTDSDDATFELGQMVAQLTGEKAAQIKVAEFPIAEDCTTWREYNVRQVPTAIVFRDGTETASFAGVQDRSFLDHFLARHTS